MEGTAYIVIIALIILSPWLVLYLYLRNVSKNLLKNYKSLSEKYGLVLDTSKKVGLTIHPESNGVYRNIPISIGSFMRGSGRRKYDSTYIKVECLNPDRLNFFIVKRSRLNKALYGSDGIQTGDKDFDEKFIVGTTPAFTELMNWLLNFSIKYKLLQILNLGFKGEITLENSLLQYTEPELISRETNLLRIELMLHLLCEISDELNQKNIAVIQNAHNSN